MPLDKKDFENKKSAQLGRFFLAIVIGLSTISLIIYIAGASDVIKNLKKINFEWATYLFLASIGIIIVDSLRTYYLSKVSGYKMKYSKALENSIFGFYVSAITPFSAGGQPFQIWHLTKLGLTVGEASMIVGIKFITSFSITVVWGFTALLLYRKEISSIPYIGKIFILGTVLTVGMYIFFLFMVLNPKFIKIILTSPIIFYPMKFFLRKDKNQLRKQITQKVEEYKNALLYFWKSSKSSLIYNSVLSFVMIFLILSTPYLSIKAFYQNNLPFFEITGIQSALNLVVYFMPSPGSSGGIEGAFYLAYSKFVPRDIVAAAVILWRIATYYLSILLGIIITTKYIVKTK